MLSIVAIEDLYLEQLDVKTAFLRIDLDEQIYMQNLAGFFKRGKENMVCRLKKSLYGLKTVVQDGFMHREGFQNCNADQFSYFKRSKPRDISFY